MSDSFEVQVDAVHQARGAGVTQADHGLLCIDMGNSLTKWCEQPGQVHAFPTSVWGAQMPADGLSLEQSGLLDAVKRCSSVWAVSVSDPKGVETLQDVCRSAGRKLHVLTSESPFDGLVNGYEQPAALGADRWALAIAAFAAHPGEHVVTVGLGTATTVDWVSAQGRFEGGLILPGFDLMLASLSSGTARLPVVGLDAAHADVPRTTARAIASGVVHAQLGAVRAFVERLGLKAVKLMATGGHAPGFVQAWTQWFPLDAHCPVESPHRVLHGLRAWAQQETQRG